MAGARFKPTGEWWLKMIVQVFVLCGMLLAGGRWVGDKYYVTKDDAKAAHSKLKEKDEEQDKVIADQASKDALTKQEVDRIAKEQEILRQDMRALLINSAITAEYVGVPRSRIEMPKEPK
jgi:hypothetical protein